MDPWPLAGSGRGTSEVLRDSGHRQLGLPPRSLLSPRAGGEEATSSHNGKQHPVANKQLNAALLNY